MQLILLACLGPLLAGAARDHPSRHQQNRLGAISIGAKGLTKGPKWTPLKLDDSDEVTTSAKAFEGVAVGARAGSAQAISDSAEADVGVTRTQRRSGKKEEGYSPFFIYGGIAVLVLIVIATGAYLVYFLRRKSAKEAEEEAGEIPCGSGEGAAAAAAEKGDEEYQSAGEEGGEKESSSAMSSAEGDNEGSATGSALAVKEATAEETVDYEKMLRVLTQRVAQKFGPKLAKGQAVRNIVEERALTIKEKAKAFFLNELNVTAGQLLQAIEAEEAMLLLDFNSAVATNFPPVSVLLAGLLSPALLTVRQIAHLLQLVLGLLPILILCTWAIIADWKTVCAIPTIYAWVYVQGGLALILTFSHVMVHSQIVSGKKDLQAKASQMHERLMKVRGDSGSDEGMGLNEMRELFVCSTVLLQQALLVEDGVRHSIWHKLCGAGSLLWFGTIVWNFVIVMGWTFMPGIIAFHPKAATVAAEAFCGALITVLAARIICVLHLVFLAINIMTLVSWLIDCLTESPSFGTQILEQASKVDEGLLGVPVVQTLVRAFVLRGGMDLASSKFAVASYDRARLEKERLKAAAALAEIDSQLAAQKAVEEKLKERAGYNTSRDLETNIGNMESLGAEGLADWKAKGTATIEDLKAQAAALEEATTKDIEIMIQKITDAAQAVQDSDAYKSAMAKAEEAAALAQEKAQEAAQLAQENLTAENLEKIRAQAMETAQAGMASAQDMAQAAMESETLQKAKDMAASAVQQVQESEALQQGMEAVSRGVEQIQQSETYQQAKQQVAEGVQKVQDSEAYKQAQEQVAQGVQAVQDSEAYKQAADMAQQGAEEVQKQVQKGVETVQESETFKQTKEAVQKKMG